MTTGRLRGLRAVRWQVDVEHSSARFSVRNFGFNIVHGTVPITHAYVDVDGRGAVVGSYAELDLSRLSTGNRRRDNDLRKPSLLDSRDYPRLTFGARRADPSPTGWSVTGCLTSRGRSADIELTVTPTGEGSPERTTITATGTLDRRDLGVRAPRLVIGRRVEIVVYAVLLPVVE